MNTNKILESMVKKMPYGENDYTQPISPKMIMGLNWAQLGNIDYKIPAIKEVKRKIESWLYENYPHLRQMYYNGDTYQAIISVAFVKNEPFEKQFQEINDFIPFILPSVERYDSMIGKHICVMEKSLSEYTSYNVWIVNERAYLYAGSRVQKEGTVEEVMRFIWQNHYYSRNTDPTKDWEEDSERDKYY